MTKEIVFPSLTHKARQGWAPMFVRPKTDLFCLDVQVYDYQLA